MGMGTICSRSISRNLVGLAVAELPRHGLGVAVGKGHHRLFVVAPGEDIHAGNPTAVLDHLHVGDRTVVAVGGTGLLAEHDFLGRLRTLEGAKQSSVRNPSAKIMFGEEPGSTDSHDSPVPNVEVIQDGRWIPGVNVLTRRHNKQAVVAFADGHAQAVPWEFGNSETNQIPGY